MSKQISVLIDDRREVVRVGLQALCAQQFDLQWLGDGREFAEWGELEARHPVDVAVISWPDGGIGEVRRLARSWLAYGIDDHPANLLAALAAGAAGFVQEGTTGAELMAALRLAAGGGRVWHEEELEAIQLWQIEVYGRWQRLSERERDVAWLLSEGASNKEIAERLVVSVKTVEAHVHDILSKLGARSRSEAAVWLLKHGVGTRFGERDAGPPLKD